MNETFHVGDWIHDLAKLLKQETDSTLATMSLGQGQLMLFMFLLRHASDEQCFQEQIAKAMGLNKANVSRNVAKLEQKGPGSDNGTGWRRTAAAGQAYPPGIGLEG
jgi:predicted XRE-type DNA-binding protein